MSHNVNPALFIGLGGTGYKIALQVKKALISNYGEVPPVIKILCFDTDVSPLTSHKESVTYYDKDSGERVTKEIGLESHEIIAIPVRNPDRLLRFQHIKNWLSDKIAPMITPGDNGAKQIRSQGRFAFFENYNTQKIKDKISDSLSALEGRGLSRNLNYSFLGTPRIHLIFSPCGGTGSGTFVDMAMTIKDINPGISLYGWLVMPDFYTGFPMTTNVIKNSYASLIEIDHMMGKDAAEGKKWSNYPKQPYEVDYTGGGDKVTLGSSKFFDYVYLFDNKMENGKVILDVEDAYDMIGRILYLMVSGPGDAMLTSYSNNSDWLHPSSPETGGKRRNYSSMGLSQVILDREYLKSLKVNKISKSILNSFLNLNKSVDERDFDNFINSNSWREDRGKDEVIDRMFPRSNLKYDTESLYPPQFRKECNVELSQTVGVFLNDWDGKVRSVSRNVLENLYPDFTEKLNEQINDYMNSMGGLPKCQQFVSYLSGAFSGMRDEMEKESTSHKLNAEKLENDNASYIEAIVEAENSLVPFGRSARIKEACRAYVGNAERILVETFEYNRKDTARLFYDKCMLLLQETSDKLKAVHALVLEATTDIERETQNLLNNENNEKDFERSIHKFYKDILIVKDKDVNLQEAFGSIRFSNFMNMSRVSEIRQSVRAFAESTGAIQEVSQLTVEKVLQELPANVVKNIISYLDTSSNVCIELDTASFLQNTAKPTMEKFGFICVEDEDSSVFEENGELHKKLSAGGGYNQLRLFSTGNPDRISMIKVAGMFPACAINRIKSHKAQFELSNSRGGYHFSDVYFERNAMDLVDVTDDDDNLKWFAVGSALNKIRLHKRAIYLEYEDKQMMPLFEGTRGTNNRYHCFNYFKKKKDYIKFIEKLYDIYFEEKGKEEVTKMLVNFYNSLDTIEVLGKQFENIDHQSDEYRHIFNERRAIKEFALSNGIDPSRFDM